jgi:hypothetical protein
MQYAKIHRLRKTDHFFTQKTLLLYLYTCVLNLTSHNCIVNIGKEAIVSTLHVLTIIFYAFLVIRTQTYLFLRGIRQDSQNN